MPIGEKCILPLLTEDELAKLKSESELEVKVETDSKAEAVADSSAPPLSYRHDDDAMAEILSQLGNLSVTVQHIASEQQKIRTDFSAHITSVSGCSVGTPTNPPAPSIDGGTAASV